MNGIFTLAGRSQTTVIDTIFGERIIESYNPHVLDMGCGAPSGALAFWG